MMRDVEGMTAVRRLVLRLLRGGVRRIASAVRELRPRHRQGCKGWQE